MQEVSYLVTRVHVRMGFSKHIKNINQSALIIQLTDCLPTIDKNISINV